MPQFRDIHTFPRGSYSVQVSWNYLEKHIVDHEKDTGLDLDPVFQRGHVWSQAQQEAYIEYILGGGASGKDLYFNCPGWGLSFKGPYVIIDGKQRLEAVRRFMRGELRAFGHTRHEYTDKPDTMLCRFTWTIASIDSYPEVLKWYLHFNTGGTPHSAEEIEKVKRLLELAEQNRQ